MSEAPKQPRNAEVVSKDGQFNQAHARWWDAISKRAYDFAETFKNIVNLTATSTVAPADDYLVIYDESENAARKVLVQDIARPASVELIEAWTVTATGSKVFSSIPQTYRSLLLVVSGVRRSAAFSSLINVEVSDDNGSSYASAVVARTALSSLGSATPSIATLSASTVPIGYVRDGAFVSSAAFSLNGYFSGASLPKGFSASGGVTNWGGASEIGSVLVDGVITSVGPIDAIRFSIASGTFSAVGTATLYGIN